VEPHAPYTHPRQVTQDTAALDNARSIDELPTTAACSALIIIPVVYQLVWAECRKQMSWVSVRFDQILPTGCRVDVFLPGFYVEDDIDGPSANSGTQYTATYWF
jgi:hypothetical protein